MRRFSTERFWLGEEGSSFLYHVLYWDCLLDGTGWDGIIGIDWDGNARSCEGNRLDGLGLGIVYLLYVDEC